MPGYLGSERSFGVKYGRPILARTRAKARNRAKNKAKNKANNVGGNSTSTSAEVDATSSTASAGVVSKAETDSQGIPKIPYLFVDNERLEEFLSEEKYGGGREFTMTQHSVARVKDQDHDHIPTFAANAGEAPSRGDSLPPSSSNHGVNLNSNNQVTSPLDRGASTQSQHTLTPLQEAVATPPIILSVAETGIDYTEVLEELVTKGIKYTKLEAVFNEASEDQVEQLIKIAKRKFFGLKTRNNYLEDCHHLMLAGVAVRDASVTDISNADLPSEITNDAGDVTASEGDVSASAT